MIGRKKAIDELTRSYESTQSELVVLYGRRRVGKTYLVNEVFGRKFSFHHSGLKGGNKSQQLKQFRLSLRQQGYWHCPALHDWQEAFFELGNFLAQTHESRKVVFIDEMPWLDTFRSDFVMAFEGFWNGWASFRTDILLIVCGSATSWVINKVLHNKAGLHNRVSARIRLHPFTLNECEQYAAERGLGMDRSQIMECYMAFGGVAYYWSLLKRGRSAEQNINDLFFAAQDGLKDEFNELYDSLFSNSENYKAIVMKLREQSSGMQREDILKALGKVSGGDLTRRLEELEECGFIRSYRNGSQAKNGMIYQLIDPFTLFYFTFQGGFQNPSSDYWTQRVSPAVKSNWRGRSFERVCLAHIEQIKKALGISGVSTEVYAWQARAQSNSESGAQIDLLIDRNDGVVNICEMKYSRHPYVIDKEEADKLINRLELFGKRTGTKKILHLTLVSPYGLEHTGHWGIVQSQVTMDDLFM